MYGRGVLDAVGVLGSLSVCGSAAYTVPHWFIASATQWLSILVSPIPAVRQLGNWSAASYVKVRIVGGCTVCHVRYADFVTLTL